MNARTFFYSFLSLVLLLLLSLGAFNWLVNPILLFASPEIDGLNRHKTQWFFSQLIAKPYAVRRRQPDALLMGTSRAGFTLDPTHPAWQNYAPYNYALAGTTTMVQWHSFQHASRVRPVRRMILGLDLFMFNACRLQHAERPILEYIERLRPRAGEINWQWPRRNLSDHATALLSLDITRKSSRTIASQEQYRQSAAGFLTARQDGFWRAGFPPGRSHRQMFRIIERQYIGSDWFPEPDRCYSLERDGHKVQLDYLEKIVRLAHAQETETILFFSPFHARLAEAMRLVGVWPEFEQLKRDALEVTQSVASDLGVQPFPLWDFSGYNTINNEPVPPAGDKVSRMRWYADGTHGTAALGNLLQDKLFSMSTADSPPVPDFGVLLDQQTIEQHLAAVRRAGEAYREASPLEVRDVYNIAFKAGAIADAQ